MVTRANQTRIMHRSVECGGVVYFGGVVADDRTVSMGDQTRQICAKLDGYLREAGTDRNNILFAQIFLSDMSAKAQMDEAWLDWIPAEALPARATVGVADLGSPDTLIEVVITVARSR